MNKILKNIIYILMTISMFFSITSTVSANNNLSLPSNYEYLSDGAKKEVLVRLIVQIQERIQEIIAQQQEKKVVPAPSIASENNMSLATKVVLKSIDLVNSKMTEKGSGSFKLKINETDSDEKYDLSLDFQDVKYKISSDKEKGFDFHLDARYSLDLKKKVQVDYQDGNAVYEDYNEKITNDFISLDVILLKNNFKFKINGFEKTVKFIKEDFVKEIKSDNNISEADKKEYIEDVKSSVNLFESSIKGKWIGSDDDSRAISVNKLKIPSKDIEKMKKMYLKNQFILFSNNCQKVSINDSNCAYTVKADLKKFSKFFKEYRAEFDHNDDYNTVVKYDFFEKFIDNFENNIKSDYYISIDSKNRIIAEDMKMEIVYDDNDLRKYGGYIPESTKINFKTEISIKSMTEYDAIIRDLKKEINLNELMARIYFIFM